jgi:hypothetical protein
MPDGSRTRNKEITRSITFLSTELSTAYRERSGVKRTNSLILRHQTSWQGCRAGPLSSHVYALSVPNIVMIV